MFFLTQGYNECIEIRCPTPNYIKKKRQGKFKKLKSIFNKNSEQDCAGKAGTKSIIYKIVIPTSSKLHKPINDKILKPIKSFGKRKLTIENEGVRINVSPEDDKIDNSSHTDETQTNSGDEKKDKFVVQLKNIFGAFCRRKSKRNKVSKLWQSDHRNASFVRPVTHELGI
jgi:hypothetical protein